MSESASGKICVVCGESCEDRPRVKDPRGRYFCRPCYEKALAKKRIQRERNQTDPPSKGSGADAETGAASAQRGGALDADDWESSLLDDLDAGANDAAEDTNGERPLRADGNDEDEDNSATAASTGGVCPNCGADFPLAAVICVNCGFNTTTGHTVESKLGGTVVAKEDLPTDTIWPSVIGILAIVIGVGYAGLSVWGLVELLLSGGEAVHVEGAPIDSTASIIIASIATLPFVALMAWHAFAGIGLIQRRAWGWRQMRLWSRTVILIVATIWILLVGLMGVLAIMTGGVMELLAIIVTSAAGAGLYLAWPIFLALWLGRERIEAEVEMWE